MGKYERCEKALFSVFGSTEWKSEKIKAVPNNFNLSEIGSEFIRISIIPSGRGLNLMSLSGMIIVDIFVPANEGPKRASIIADTLDSYLVGKTIVNGGTLQLGGSSVDNDGYDKENPSLYRVTYSIPFNFFEVL